MKIVTLFDDSIIEDEVGWDSINHKWDLNGYKSILLEDGSIFENPDFDLEQIKIEKIKEIENQIYYLIQKRDTMKMNNLNANINDIDLQIDKLKVEKERIENL